MPKSRYVLGEKVGRLIIISKTDKRKNGQVVWLCECDCGNISEIPTGYLQSGDTKTCGRCNNKWYIYEDICECVVKSNNGEIKTFIIDSKDYEFISIRNWYINESGYVISWMDKKHIRLHRLIINPNDGFDIDHINGNTLDNRRKNLRICTRQQNSMNQKNHSNNTSGKSGVTFNKKSKKWCVSIGYKYKRIFIGYYKTKDEAINARMKAEKEYYGEYARNEAK